jgi:hypothetical protein
MSFQILQFGLDYRFQVLTVDQIARTIPVLIVGIEIWRQNIATEKNIL